MIVNNFKGVKEYFILKKFIRYVDPKS